MALVLAELNALQIILQYMEYFFMIWWLKSGKAITTKLRKC